MRALKNLTHAEKILIYPFFLLLPFVQMGISFYVSVQMVLFIALLFSISAKFYIKNLGYYLLLFMVMVVPSLFYTVNDQLHMILGSARQWVCVCVLIAAMSFQKRIAIEQKKVEKMITYLLLAMLSITVLQSIGLHAGFNFFVPYQWLIANMGTAKGIEKVYELGLSSLIRPTVTFGEPSYLSFIVTTLLYLSFFLFSNKLKVRFIIVVAALICVIAQSLSGFLSIAVLSSVYLLNQGNVRAVLKNVLMVIGFLLFVIFAASGTSLIDRMLSVQTGASSTLRLIAPFLVIDYVFNHYPFGMPKEVLFDVYGEGSVIGTDNGALNIFINYGFSGVLVWAIILIKAWRKEGLLLLAYIVLSSMFNGAFFALDKAAVMGGAIVLASVFKQLKPFNLKIGVSN